MGVRKNTYVEDYRMVHTWTDPEHNFTATVQKQDGRWVVDVCGEVSTADTYSHAVDCVMDAWRRATGQEAQR